MSNFNFNTGTLSTSALAFFTPPKSKDFSGTASFNDFKTAHKNVEELPKNDHGSFSGRNGSKGEVAISKFAGLLFLPEVSNAKQIVNASRQVDALDPAVSAPRMGK